MFNNQELIPEFVIEGKAHVEKIEAGLLEVERGHEDPQLINSIFRSAHSIKGTAGFFGLNKIVELAHAMENLLEKIRHNEVKIDLEMIDNLLEANDKLREILENWSNSDNVNIAPYIHKLNNILGEARTNENINLARTGLPSIKTVGVKSINENKVNSEVDGSYEKSISEAIKHGQKFYKLLVNFDQLAGGNKKRTEILSNIRLIGKMIAHYTCKEDGSTEGAREVFLFSTVLERDLILMGLDLNETIDLVLEETTQAEFTNLLFAGQAASVGRELSAKSQQVPGRDDAGNSCTYKEEDRIRVNVNLLDSLVNLSSELVLGRNQLLRILENHTDDITGLNSVLQKIDRITTELQEKVMRTRMQPLANVFDKMPRFVRELSKSIGKKVDLQIEGRGVELDKSIIEGLADPLAHLVRNALDHGIETPDIRKTVGKDETAALRIKAYHEGGRAIIDIIDDGAGINVNKIKQSALRQGIISKEQTADINERDLLRLIFLPGFSTADQVTDISGRGVGLDVAKSNIEKLGGTVEVQTAGGIGTTIRLILPLTLAIIPSIIVEIMGYRFALPQINLQEIVRIRPGDSLRKLELIQGRMVLRIRDKLLPVISMADMCGMPALDRVDTCVIKVLIIKSTVQVFGLIVDAIHDREEILVKPVPRYLKDSKGYSGVTILGDGKIAMVLDVDGMAAAVKLTGAEEQAPEQRSSQETIGDKDITKQEILLFKCSGPELFGLDLSMVARVDEIDPSQIEAIGNNEYINLHGNVLRLVRPEDFLPIAKAKTSPHKLGIIIPKMAKCPAAILVEKIQDTIQAEMLVQEGSIKTNGILGSAILNDRIVLMVNLLELFELAYQQPCTAKRTSIKMSKIKKVLLRNGGNHDR